MRVTIALLGFELDLTFGPATDEHDPAAALNGGTLASDRLEPGTTDRYMGFTNGREDEPGDRGQ